MDIEALNGIVKMKYVNFTQKKLVKKKNGKWEPEEEYLCKIYPKPAFPDTRDYVYQNALFYVKENNIMTGFDDGNFKPNDSLNRAELMKIVIEAKFPEEAKGENCF